MMTTKVADVLTTVLSRAADILFAANPRGTSLGAFTGVAVDLAGLKPDQEIEAACTLKEMTVQAQLGDCSLKPIGSPVLER
jgi:hypothetical protein